ncbi:ArgP/LysG family DNA-binding transcriptional regulator [Falsihalocynthiibacter sp. S25ZX9]|uniref:ArgP/LysG family DNA-binding transcriptional regulator n=1 Tax=Falsihalocynthiibacter sp. S25ZX9 TaxID=3240870 RepID=UPI003510BF50
MALLEATLCKDLGLPNASPTPPYIKIATNADSLASCLMPALVASEGVMYELIVDDQEHSAEWLRRGEVQAAITSHSTAIQGSDSASLESLRYIASASPEFIKRWCPQGITDEAIRTAPALLDSHKDKLQREWVHRQLGHNITTQNHKIPSARGFVDAALLGMGCGMNPEVLIRGHLTQGRLVALDPATPLDIPLFWQVNRRVAPALAPLTKAVKLAAAKALLPP